MREKIDVAKRRLITALILWDGKKNIQNFKVLPTIDIILLQFLKNFKMSRVDCWECVGSKVIQVLVMSEGCNSIRIRGPWQDYV